MLGLRLWLSTDDAKYRAFNYCIKVSFECWGKNAYPWKGTHLDYIACHCPVILLVSGVGLLMCEAAVAAKTGGNVSLSQKLWARAQQLAPLGQCAALPKIKIN